jgi:hypothetical protein
MLQIVRQQEFSRKVRTPHLIIYVVADSTRKPPGTTNLFVEEDYYTGKINHNSCRRRRIKWFHFCPPATTLVHISAVLSTEGTCPMIEFTIAAESLTIF